MVQKTTKTTKSNVGRKPLPEGKRRVQANMTFPPGFFDKFRRQALAAGFPSATCALEIMMAQMIERPDKLEKLAERNLEWGS